MEARKQDLEQTNEIKVCDNVKVLDGKSTANIHIFAIDETVIWRSLRKF